ncbi:membrane protein [Rhizoctonia solani]|uniref:Membrane protein n=1 Tax=Rhizoctonia solani TaxID=456999 RepID=A0A8H8P3N4_9AGAM|nr:uncharacterized protein RhiXN_11457 [Rhizoctonia solani]QRW24545.1 membrane protein [Rhizoctonia solani]
MVIYEWRDARYLGIDTEPDNYLVPKTYVCTQTHRKPHTSFVRVGLTVASWLALSPIARHVNTIVPTGVLWYKEPILYQVDKKGYYCVAAIPITTGATADTAVHASFTGQVLFQTCSMANWQRLIIPRSTSTWSWHWCTHPGGVWGFLCFRHRDDLLPLQYYISYLVGFLVIEMTATWAYYRYLNSHHRGTATTMFLAVVAILDAGKRTFFFLLLVVSLGLSVVRESLGPAMTRVKLLAGAHFVFGVLYAMGMVELELESASALLLLMFVIPLSFTLSGFLLWIMYALNGTMAELADRKQTYKLSMFRTLYRILLQVLSFYFLRLPIVTLPFADYAPETWETRWYLLDAWLAILYLVVFTSIAFLWRPTGNNRRLAMSEELAQDEDAAGEYDLESMRPGGLGGPSEENLAGGNGARAPLRHEDVVFEIGDEDDDDDG